MRNRLLSPAVAVSALVTVCLLLAVASRPARCMAADDALQRVHKAEQERIELVRRVSPTVVSVFRVHKKTGELARGSGSGVIISADGYALTNHHVTASTEQLRVGLPSGKIYKAALCGEDPTGDIAVIKIESDAPLPYAALGSSGELSVGEWVIAMGNPFRLATDFRPTVSMGVVSGLHRYLPGAGMFQSKLIYADAIQVDAALNPGNSGGPLFNMRGELVGINGRIALRRVAGMQMKMTNAGIGFAVPVDGVKPFLDDLKAGRDVDRGYIGITKAEPTEAGLKITEMAIDSPAEVFGLRQGDVILRVDGAETPTLAELVSLALMKPAGTKVTVELRRGDETLERTVQLAGAQSAAWLKMMTMRARLANPESLINEKKPEENKEEPKAEGGEEKPAPDEPQPQDKDE